jgi:hypothetical protein
MLSVDNKTLIAGLTRSYTHQLELYKTLTALVQKALSHVVLSRGDLSGLIPVFTKKQELIDTIVKERQEMDPSVRLWQDRKADLRQSAQSQELDELLKTTQSAIFEFLEYEEQLKKYLEHVLKKGTTVS